MRKAKKNVPYKACPACGGVPALLGGLGNLIWYRCRDCGAEYSTKARKRVRRNGGVAVVVGRDPSGANHTLTTFSGPAPSFGARAHVRQIRTRAARGGNFFTGWKAGYAMLKNRKVRKTRSRKNSPAWVARRREFVNYLRDTLIPDLREAGMVETAKDFVTAVRFMRMASRDAYDFMRYLRDTLIPDLKKAGYVSTAKDFETARGYILRTLEKYGL